MKKLTMISVLLLAASVMASQVVVDFEELTLGDESYWGGPGSGQTGFSSKGANFPHNDGVFSWDGFVYSNQTDNETSGYLNQYSAITGGGADGSDNYAIAWLPLDWMGNYDVLPVQITFDAPTEILGASFTNTTYAYWAMVQGDGPARAFLEDDYLKLSISGLDSAGQKTNTIEFLLGSGRTIIEDWTWVNLSALGVVSRIEFNIEGSDVGNWGLNTPAYFAMDNLTYAIPEPATLFLLGLGTVIFRKVGRKNS